MSPLLALLLAAPLSASGWLTDAPAAFAQAKASGKPVLADFMAPWCYSCYYMEQRVLSKPGFAALAGRFVLLKLDVDTPAGAAMKAERAVTFLPSYLALSASGEELGRVVGEQTEADFLEKLAALAGGGDAGGDKELAALRAKARKGDASALEALLERPADCETPYDVSYAAAAVAKLPAERRSALLGKERRALEALAEKRLFGGAQARCADFRSGVDALADVRAAQGEADAGKALYARALSRLDEEGKTAGEDRNRDDNRRYFLDKAGDPAASRAWYEALVKAYPADYVYSYRYAKWLHKRGEDAAAAEWAGKADRLSYGANRLTVTALRAEILGALGRTSEALAAVDRDLKASAKTWKAQREELERVRASLRAR